MAPGQQVCSRASRVQAPQLDSEQDVKCAGSTAEPRSSARPPGSLGDSSKDFHQGTGGGCQGYETAVPQPRESKDLARAVPSDSTRRGPSVLSGRDRWRGARDEPPISRAPVPTAHPAFGVGEGVRVAHRDRHKVLAHLGHPGAWACVTLPATQHVTRVPETDWRLRAPLGGQGQGLRGDSRARGRRQQAENTGRSSEPQRGQEPRVFRGERFPWCLRAVHRPPTDHRATTLQCSRGRTREAGR